MILDKFHWEFKQNFCIDLKQLIRTALYETIKFGFKNLQDCCGYENASFFIFTECCVGVKFFVKKRG